MWKSGSLVGVTEQKLRLLLMIFKAKIVKLAEKNVSKKSLIWSLILAAFPDMDQGDQLEMLLRCTGKKHAELVPDEITEHALNAMPPDEVSNHFQGLKSRLDKRLADKKFKEDVSRRVGDRGSAQHFTPDCKKSLKPPWQNCALTLDVGRESFEAYYPAGRPTKSVAMKFTGEDRSKLSALTYCLEYLWRDHRGKGRVSCFNFSTV